MQWDGLNFILAECGVECLCVCTRVCTHNSLFVSTVQPFPKLMYVGVLKKSHAPLKV